MIQELHEQAWKDRGIRVSVLRLDKLHPVVSGNKWFKLQGFLDKARLEGHRHLVSFGGAYSNHLVALAYAARDAGLQCTGIVRGEKPRVLSLTLEQCKAYGMTLLFTTRKAYAVKAESSFTDGLIEQLDPHLLIPEGGYHPLGAAGAAGIPALAGITGITDWVVAMGTATTAAGILAGTATDTRVTGITVLKGMTDTRERLHHLLGSNTHDSRFTVQTAYAFGGYAKPDKTLFAFMNEMWVRHSLPLDFVYTAKMLYGLYDLVAKNYFAPGAHVLCVHTGGLQGNRSLSTDTLVF